MRIVVAVLIALPLGAVAALALQEPRSEAPPSWEVFELEALLEKAAGTKEPWLGFLDRSTLHVGLYRLPKGGVDAGVPHRFVEIEEALEIEVLSSKAPPGGGDEK